MPTPRILILGGTGMVGRAVYKHLHKLWPKSVWATARKKPYLPFEVDFGEKGLEKIHKSLGIQKFDLIINCIGKLRKNQETETDIQDCIRINSLFPHQLAQWCESKNINLVHISTDAVYANEAGTVTEKTAPAPEDWYALSKLMGEPNTPHTLVVRTSFLGIDPLAQKGLVELALKPEQPTGFTNQTWSGCSTQQFAQLCQFLAEGKHFATIRKNTPVVNFSPLGPVSKYTILSTVRQHAGLSRPQKTRAALSVTRKLQTNYGQLTQSLHLESDLARELQRVLNDPSRK